MFGLYAWGKQCPFFSTIFWLWCSQSRKVSYKGHHLIFLELFPLIASKIIGLLFWGNLQNSLSSELYSYLKLKMIANLLQQVLICMLFLSKILWIFVFWIAAVTVVLIWSHKKMKLLEHNMYEPPYWYYLPAFWCLSSFWCFLSKWKSNSIIKKPIYKWVYILSVHYLFFYCQFCFPFEGKLQSQKAFNIQKVCP